ncbi:class I SAM-dependent methyltransferase [Turneriella parva]|nr:class I SAM-dependent methyltransferase [Turneriella parva]
MKKHLGKWARRRGISCYRLYEKDIPEYPFIADLYEDHMILTEMASEAIQSRRDYHDWKKQATEIFRSTWEIRPENLHLKTRVRRTEGEQYEKLSEGVGVVVHEAGLKFKIYPDNWLDTGLFLDHRNLRSVVRESAAGNNVLNLFCYTGSFSVYAAAGGAALVHSVDLSARYLSIVDENLALNKLSAVPHDNFRLDAREFLATASPGFYDIIICDAPVFSKSRRQERDFDVLRDSPQLVRDCLRALKPGGVLYFSTNFRKFSLRYDGNAEGALVKNISAQTIPEDFRNKWIHTCYEIRHGA